MAKPDADASNGRLPGGVQSIARAFDLLETMADLGGIVGLSQLASQSGLPLPRSQSWARRRDPPS